MALHNYHNPETDEYRQSLKSLDDPWVRLLSAPNTKLNETVDSHKNKSRVKGLAKVLKARARVHSRDVEMDSNIAFNRANGREAQIHQGLLNSKGERRRAIDDM